MTDLAFSEAEVQALRQELRRLEVMNQAMIDAGKAVVAERDRLRVQERDDMEQISRLRVERENWHASNYAERQARLSAEAERDQLRQERDYLGPRFIEDMCDLFGIERGDLLRMDKIAGAVKELVASADRNDSREEGLSSTERRRNGEDS